MSMLPYVMVRNMFDELSDSAFTAHSTTGIMRTDISENDAAYEVAIDLPGVKKENLSVELKDGYLVVSATVERNDDSAENRRYLRRERFVGSLRRSFYVGDKVQQDSIHAKFENGTLVLTIPKVIQVAEPEQKNLIAIEG